MKRRGITVGIGIASVMLAAFTLISCSAAGAENNVSNGPVDSLGGDYSGAPVGGAAQQPVAASNEVQDGDIGGNRQGEQNLQGGGAVGQPGQTQDRLVIRNATLSVIVTDPQAKIREIGTLAETLGGWIVSSNTSTFTNMRGEPAVRGTIVVRVPVAQLDQVLEQIRANNISVTSDNVTGEDVTQSYVDTASQLRNLEAAEVQLQRIMEQADDVEEVMIVYDQLITTRGEIEVARGRLQYYEGAAAFSAITVYVEPEAVQPLPVVQTAGWNPLATLGNALSGLLRLTQSLMDVGIALLVYGCPLALIVGIPALILRARRPRPTPAVPTPPAT